MPTVPLLPPDFNQHAGIYLTAVLLGVIAAVFMVAMWPTLQQPIPVQNYAECAKQGQSHIQEGSPRTCVSTDGQQFTQQPTPTPWSSPSATPGNQP